MLNGGGEAIQVFGGGVRGDFLARDEVVQCCSVEVGRCACGHAAAID